MPRVRRAVKRRLRLLVAESFMEGDGALRGLSIERQRKKFSHAARGLQTPCFLNHSAIRFQPSSAGALR